MFEHPSFDRHERVVFAHDAGGSRFWPAGGIITAQIHRIPNRLTEIFQRSNASNRPTSDIADDMARQLLAEAR